jgi:hypothetical protein
LTIIILTLSLAVVSVMTAVLLRSPTYRRLLHDRWTLALFVSVPAVWLFLLPWTSAFGPSGVAGLNPSWVSWPVVVVLLSFPVLAALLIARTKGARTVSVAYVLVNIPVWLLSCFVAGMAATGTGYEPPDLN